MLACVWCNQPIPADVTPVRMAGDALHPACAPELETELWGAPLGATPRPPLDESDALVWETALGLDHAVIDGYSEGYRDGMASGLQCYHLVA